MKCPAHTEHPSESGRSSECIYGCKTICLALEGRAATNKRIAELEKALGNNQTQRLFSGTEATILSKR